MQQGIQNENVTMAAAAGLSTALANASSKTKRSSSTNSTTRTESSIDQSGLTKEQITGILYRGMAAAYTRWTKAGISASRVVDEIRDRERSWAKYCTLRDQYLNHIGVINLEEEARKRELAKLNQNVYRG